MCFNNLSGSELVALSGLVSTYLSSQLTAIEMANLSAFLSSIATNLAIFAASDVESL